MSHHTNDTDCPKCLEKLEMVHPYMQNWFLWVKSHWSEAHVAVGWRNEQDQNSAYMNGRSKLPWPQSLHNHMDMDNPGNLTPCSKALDIFQIIDHRAIFDGDWCQEVNDLTKQNGYKIRWGGSFQSIPDLDHFELVGDESN